MNALMTERLWSVMDGGGQHVVDCQQAHFQMFPSYTIHFHINLKRNRTHTSSKFVEHNNAVQRQLIEVLFAVSGIIKM